MQNEKNIQGIEQSDGAEAVLHEKGLGPALPTEQQDAILSRVEGRLLESFREREASQGHSSASSGFRWNRIAWSGGGLAFAMCLAVFWLVFKGNGSALPDLETQGKLELKSVSSKKGIKQTEVKILAGRAGVITQKDHWEVKADTRTAFRITQSSKRKSTVNLQRGNVNIHVHPGTMEHFSVDCKNGFRVLVKGTRFTVTQHSDWLRVEVWRGEVEVQSPNGTIYSVKETWGIRINLDSGEPRRYKLPPLKERAPSSRFLWNIGNQKDDLFPYVEDLIESRPDDESVQDQLAMYVADHLRRRRRFAYAQKFYARMIQWHNKRKQKTRASKNSLELALRTAIGNCKRADASGRSCVRFGRSYLLRFPNRTLEKLEFDKVVYGFLKNKYPVRPSDRKWLKRYLKVKRARYRWKVRRLLKSRR
mgnify:CR=1 FL=1